MKVLSIKQPYAELIVSGKKKIELRKWSPNFRGEFLVHASKKADEASMKKFGFASLPLGCVVGKASLIGVKKYANKEEHEKDKELHLASSDWGNYGFVLANPSRVEKVYVKGKLGFWNFD